MVAGAFLQRTASAVRGLPLRRIPAGPPARVRGGRAHRRGRPLQVFWRVVFPLLRPVTGTVVILNAIFVWNDFLTPFLYLSGSDQQTIPVAVYGFIGQYVSQWNLVFAGLVIAVLPILIAYFVMQRHIIKGFAGG